MHFLVHIHTKCPKYSEWRQNTVQWYYFLFCLALNIAWNIVKVSGKLLWCCHPKKHRFIGTSIKNEKKHQYCSRFWSYLASVHVYVYVECKLCKRRRFNLSKRISYLLIYFTILLFYHLLCKYCANNIRLPPRTWHSIFVVITILRSHHGGPNGLFMLFKCQFFTSEPPFTRSLAHFF